MSNDGKSVQTIAKQVVEGIAKQREESAPVYIESCDSIDGAVASLRECGVDPATLAEISAATASIRVAALEDE